MTSIFSGFEITSFKMEKNLCKYIIWLQFLLPKTANMNVLSKYSQLAVLTKWPLVISYDSFLNGLLIPHKIVFSIPLTWQSTLILTNGSVLVGLKISHLRSFTVNQKNYSNLVSWKEVCDWNISNLQWWKLRFRWHKL